MHKKMHAADGSESAGPRNMAAAVRRSPSRFIYNEELAKVNSPMLVNGLGIMLVGPTIIHWGTEEQKKKHIPKILSADELWCRDIRSPARSDVASLQTRAVEEGDYFVVNGQKVWTSDAHHADMCILLVRTDPEAPKHKGISYILVDMHSPGVTCARSCKLRATRISTKCFSKTLKCEEESDRREEQGGRSLSRR